MSTSALWRPAACAPTRRSPRSPAVGRAGDLGDPAGQERPLGIIVGQVQRDPVGPGGVLVRGRGGAAGRPWPRAGTGSPPGGRRARRPRCPPGPPPARRPSRAPRPGSARPRAWARPQQLVVEPQQLRPVGLGVARRLGVHGRDGRLQHEPARPGAGPAASRPRGRSPGRFPRRSPRGPTATGPAPRAAAAVHRPPSAVARRASVSSSSASSPRASRSSGISSRSIRARPIARSTRSARTSSGPAGAVCPVVYSRWITVRTASRRSGSSAGPGTRYGIRAAEIFFLARVTRAAIVGSGTRNARAISAVVRPHTSRSVSATCASRARAGWQQVNTRRSRSSGDHVVLAARRQAGHGGASAGALGVTAPEPGSISNGSLRPQGPVAALRVERPPPRRRGQPGPRIARHALPGPGVERGDVRILNALLGHVDVAGDARRRGEHEGPLATVRVRDGRADLGVSGRSRCRPRSRPAITGCQTPRCP